MPPDESPKLPAIDERLGTHLSDRYRLDELLGEGAMGKVYRAEHVMMRKRVAVKVLHAELTRVPEVVGRFEREAMAAANIDHPNVAAATDFGKLDDGSIFLVLEFVEGQSLRDVLKLGSFSLGRALHIVRQIAAALQAAHALDIVHRDLKPENVMLVRKANDADFVKVLDFGIAKVPVSTLSESSGTLSGPITRAGMIFGTPEYMAPEQGLGKDVDNRADIYALGVVLYELLSGVRPFDEQHELGVLGQQLSKPVPPLAERAAEVKNRRFMPVPEAVELFLQRLLQREASERYSQIDEVQGVIERLISQYAPEYLALAPGSIPGTGSYPGAGSIPGVGSNPGVQAPVSRPYFNSDADSRADMKSDSGSSGVGTSPGLTQLGAGSHRMTRSLSSPLLPHGAAYQTDTNLSARLTTGQAAGEPGPSAGAFSGLKNKLAAAGVPAWALTALPIALGLVLLTLGLIVVYNLIPEERPASAAPNEAASVEAPSQPEPRQLSDEEVNLAHKQGVEALEALNKEFPGDQRVLLNLVATYTLKQERDMALAIIEELLKGDDKLRNEPAIASALWVAAQDKNSQDKAFTLLQGPMGAKGADIIYDLVTTAGVRQQVISRAAAWLETPEFDENSSPALNIAVALRRAKTCKERHGLLLRAKNVGDKRALTYMHRFANRTGCGRGGRTDCNPCLREDDRLKQAIEAIEQR